MADNWQNWVSGLIGVWLVISGFVQGNLLGPWNIIISGLLVAVLSFWSANL